MVRVMHFHLRRRELEIFVVLFRSHLISARAPGKSMACRTHGAEIVENTDTAN
jgi:hypothetical protein